VAKARVIKKNSGLTSNKIIRHVLEPHTELAIDLLRLMKRSRSLPGMGYSTGDPTYRYQIAALIIFLAGVDKTLSVVLELLYLAGFVEWKWLKGGRIAVQPGYVICSPGLSAKIDKLKGLGLDLSQLKWLIEARNRYIHDCVIHAGYSFSFSDHAPDGSPLELKASGPAILVDGPPLVALGPKEIRRCAASLTRVLAQFLKFRFALDERGGGRGAHDSSD
jgi:hypothetical protein